MKKNKKQEIKENNQISQVDVNEPTYEGMNIYNKDVDTIIEGSYGTKGKDV